MKAINIKIKLNKYTFLRATSSDWGIVEYKLTTAFDNPLPEDMVLGTESKLLDKLPILLSTYRSLEELVSGIIKSVKDEEGYDPKVIYAKKK